MENKRLKNKRMQIKYNGVTYPSVLSACKATGIVPFCVYDRLNLAISRRKHNKEYEGKTPQEIFDWVVANYETIKPEYNYEGKTYSSLVGLVKENNISYYHFLRLKKLNPNKSHEELIMEAEKIKNSQIVYSYKGKEYTNFSQLCKEYNVNGCSVYHRSKSKGETLFESFKHFAERPEKKKQAVTYNGEKFTSVASMGKAYGIKSANIYATARYKNISNYEALVYIIERDKREKIEVKN